MENKVKVVTDLQSIYDGSMYTIIGCGGAISEWVEGYEKLLQKEGIGTPKSWFSFKGKDVNEFSGAEGDDKFKNDLNFLAFELNGLNVSKLAMFKLIMRDRWFDDIIDNIRGYSEDEVDG